MAHNDERRGWAELGARFFEAGGELARAELRGLQRDLLRSLRVARSAAALFGVAFALAFWSLAALLFAAGAGLAIWLPVWAAALVLGFGSLGVAAVIAHLGRRRASQLEAPTVAARRRLDDHLAWWRGELSQLWQPPDEGMDPQGGIDPESDHRSDGDSWSNETGEGQDESWGDGELEDQDRRPDR